MRAVTVLALAAAAIAVPHDARQLQYNLYNDGTRGTLHNQADDFSADWEASAFMSRQGCSTTAQIKYCYAADLAADASKMLSTKDYPPWIQGGVGTNQRALLLGPNMFNMTKNVVTHKVRFHISTGYTAVPVGLDKSVTFVGLRNQQAWGLKALDVRARTFTGEQTSGTFLYVHTETLNGETAFPTSFPLADAIGKTIEVTYTLGVSGVTIDKDNAFVADVTAKFVDSGKQLFKVTVTKTLVPKGVINYARHRLIFGADRKASAGQKQLKVWFGDYTVDPLPILTPDRR
ncbi:hypothetical protein AURDEDRAFT_116109 [Auricularia subglabra TFB-10046 SS5]|uniref:Uncharacterized protein n=1 Tax=Auricularia subglabra (strain TFB-10046 / SS5) TaxID=717982 RepID=J0WXE9_AURST|nr:hypothetical protein AURDEDRAFT_116109 [Auricularia subglabra TFB-10046 SS5]